MESAGEIGAGAQKSAASYPIPRPTTNRARTLRRAVGRLALTLVFVLGTLGPAVVSSGCHTVPVTGRSAFNPLFGTSDEVQLGIEAYDQAIGGAPLVTSGPRKEMVERVMSRLVAVADDPGYEWEVRLIDDDSVVNAFALPGGKMAVFTGILPVTATEDGLAVVMGHEIGHVVARHGTERMTRALGIGLVLEYANLGNYQGLAEVGYQYLAENPFGRSAESESDHIGLIYMARAGYDPRAAVDFWQRMHSASGSGPPEFLSTHPSHETRVADLQRLLPEAIREYEARGGGH